MSAETKTPREQAGEKSVDELESLADCEQKLKDRLEASKRRQEAILASFGPLPEVG